MKFKTYLKQREQQRKGKPKKINNLSLADINFLHENGLDPWQFDYVKRTPFEYIFKHIKTGKIVNIRR